MTMLPSMATCERCSAGFNLVELSLAGAEGVPAQPNLACIIDYSDLGG